MAIATRTRPQEDRIPLNRAWAKLLSQNENAPKAKRLTDEGLTKEMQKLFPDKAGKTTLTRVPMIRAIYNKGTGMFASLGPARVKARKFDENGDPAPARSSKTAAQKKVAPKKTKSEKVRVKVRPKAQELEESVA